MMLASGDTGTQPEWKITWQEVSCPCCGSEVRKPVIEGQDWSGETPGLCFAVVRCGQCGLQYTNPRPDEASIAAFYAANYRPHRKPTQRRTLRNWYPLGALRGRASERRGLPWHGQGRLLDFGCGGGSFLARMADQGWKVVGLDVSETTVQTITQKLGLKAHVGTLPHPQLKPCSFDVITMWHSLEHVHQPLATLSAAYELLAPGGRLLIAVPNIQSWPYAWFGKCWFGLDLPRHLTHFEPKTLKRIVELAGFRVESIRHLKHADWLRSSAKLAGRAGQHSFAQKMFQYKTPARLAAWFCQMFAKTDCILCVAHRPG
jgi:2-polyprenyl-3-methyl-5-hydroxy-6-metoxy-1,4-benzoquinol methylase